MNTSLVPLLRTIPRAASFLAIAAIFNAAWAWTPSVVFENQLGSAYQVTHSDIGPNGVITQGSAVIAYSPVKYGNGVRVDGDGNSDSVSKIVFSTNQLSGLGNQGTLSFWVRPDHDSNYGGIARWVNVDDPTGSFFQPYVYWRGWEQTIWFQICAQPFGCTEQTVLSVPNSKFTFRAGSMFHIALVWNRLGIAGSTDRIQAYINGKLMGSTSGLAWSANLTLSPIVIGAGDYPQLATIDELTINRVPITNWATLPVKK
jgi:hypothetical protein